MRNEAIIAAAMLLVTGSAYSQTPAAAPAPKPAAAIEAKPAASTPEGRSAAALALSSEPTFDEGTAQRIGEAVQSYSDIASRGGWPAIPADARFAAGAAGAHDD